MAAPKRPLAERFWEKVDVRGPDECWPWTAATTPGGYGRLLVAGRYTTAHRIAWELANGEPVGAGLLALHNCPGGDNPLCCNPRHLWRGTAKQNTADMAAKGRASFENPQPGAANGRAKLTEAQAAEAIARYRGGGISFAALAREYGVTPAAIRFAVNGRNWRHLTEK